MPPIRTTRTSAPRCSAGWAWPLAISGATVGLGAYAADALLSESDKDIALRKLREMKLVH